MARLSYLLSVLSSRGRLLTFMNLCFFGTVFIVALVLGFLLPPQLYQGSNQQLPIAPTSVDFPVLIVVIFLFNLVVSSFLVVTLPGFMLFPLSAAFLGYRAFIWALLIFRLPTWVFLIALPTLILEGEGNAFAAVAGALVGVSWVKPKWAYKAENVSRVESVKRAFKECASLYVFVLILLFIAAVVETATLNLIN